MSQLDGLPILGVIEDVCPTCRAALAKRPQRKTKCKACGAFIYSKRRPQDRALVLCTEADRDEIEEQWAIAQGMSSRPEHNEARKTVLRAWLARDIQSRDWREVWSNTLELAKIADREQDWLTLFDMMSMSLYLTLAGADETGFKKDPIHRQLASGSLAMFAFACDGLSWDAETARRRFVQVASALGIGRQPVPDGLGEFYQATPCASPAEAWTLLAEALRPMMDW
jgi:hypothetical protein